MLLTNPLYTGFVNHKGKFYEGEHGALVDEATWNLVQSNLHLNGHTNGGGNHSPFSVPLTSCSCKLLAGRVQLRRPCAGTRRAQALAGGEEKCGWK
jgi:hypothetical protein